MSSQIRIRDIDSSSQEEIHLVAERMRQTLIEVLGEEVGGNMYPMDWLVQRVQFHLDPQQCTGRVFVSEDAEGHITGHTIVRLEPDEAEGQIGLFSTTYIEPTSRRLGVAAELLRTGENWMREQGMKKAVTYTDVDNTPLQELYLGQGYKLSEMPNNFVALSKQLD